MKEYKAMATAKFILPISKLRTDQGGEYLSKEQDKWYKMKGIQIHTTVAYSPQQNGVEERFNRTVTEKIRMMLMESQMPKKLWCEAALTGVYLINRSPTAALNDNKTPAEKWYDHSPDLNKLRMFGCKAFAWIPDQLRRKLSPKCRESVMIGYAPNGYTLWDIEKQRVFTARDDKFDEESFPFEKSPENAHIQKPRKTYFKDLEQEGENGFVENVDVIEDVSENSIIENQQETTEEENESNAEALPSPNNQCDEMHLRRSDRERKRPSKLKNFFTTYRASTAGNVLPDVPECYGDIFGREDKDLWIKAVEDELTSMEKNNVWKIVEKPGLKKIMESRWIFSIKYDENGVPKKHKARLVIKGYLQKYGFDYFETYAPVAKLTTMRDLLAVGIRLGYFFQQLDVKTAFLHGDLKEEIYMTIPDGVTNEENKVCKLFKTLYGLKQAPRCWNEKLNSYLLQIGFVRSKHDYCLYTRNENGQHIFLVLYVDDLLLVGKTLSDMENVKKLLSEQFSMSDCGELKNFLGMKIEIGSDYINLSQPHHIEKILKKFGLQDCNAVKTRMEKGLKLPCTNSDDNNNRKSYQELLGSLMYLMLCVRPDICFPISYLGRFQQHPIEEHCQSLKKVVRYLKGTKKMAFLLIVTFHLWVMRMLTGLGILQIGNRQVVSSLKF
uniref:Integrase catalytic domain-containing protein n=1 Tax=Photinus pyralis TaxID=7054 RepID=A0A1Y1JUX7_PHOPY